VPAVGAGCSHDEPQSPPVNVSDCSVSFLDPGLAASAIRASDPSRSRSPISWCHKRVRVPIDLTPDEMSEASGFI
jgi:hypothetical protein